jgi:hypothetical protein
MSAKSCPNCSEPVKRVWCSGRKLQWRCTECSWKGKPQTPEKKKIPTHKTVRVDNFAGWQFESFDKYGHISTSSRVYPSEREMMVDIDRELAIGRKEDNPAGPYTILAFNVPGTVKIKGKVYR